MTMLEEKEWKIFNGNMKADEEGQYTYTGGKGNTVIDYVLGGLEVKERIVEMEVKCKIESNHQPVEIRIKGKGVKKRDSSKMK